MKAAIDRHLRDKGYDKSIIVDQMFMKTRQAHTARKLAVKKMGLGRKAHACAAIGEEDVKRLKESGELGSDTPHSLQFSLFYHFSRGFGLRSRQDHKLMKLGEIKRTSDNVRYLELKERNSKTMDGSKKTILGVQSK